jgi:hypothetical protein
VNVPGSTRSFYTSCNLTQSMEIDVNSFNVSTWYVVINPQ